MNRFYFIYLLFIISLGPITNAFCAEFVIKTPPRPFSVVPPNGWVKKNPSTGNSKLLISSPPNTPYAECCVIVQHHKSLEFLNQTQFDILNSERTSPKEFAQQLSSTFNNVEVFSTGAVNLSGHPGNLANYLYSVGTEKGEMWARGFMSVTGTTPGLIWSIGCGGLGQTPEDAKKSFTYWQLEFGRFLTNVKIFPLDH